MNQKNLSRKQSGAVLLAFMLILVTGTSYLLLSKFNANIIRVGAEERTRQALNQAKQALIGYSVTYPDHHPGDGPGYLLCPDRNNDGATDSGACVLSSSSNTSIGRFPYKTLEAEDIKDSHGERLWYIVSNNFRNNPKLIPLNSETSGTASDSLTVNGTGNIAAVIFAPGVAQNNQNRAATGTNSLDYTNYIDAIFSSDKKTITTGASANYILLTKNELMQAVEKRVLGEVKIILAGYREDPDKDDVNGIDPDCPLLDPDCDAAYPWLTPFADPKAEFKGVQGTHTGSDGSSNLTDSSMDFVDLGIQIGDIVRNITDGSIATVNNVTTNTLALGTLSSGMDNDFDSDDQYEIYSDLSGTASAGSSGLVLQDTSRDFEDMGIVPGDVIDILDPVTRAVLSSGMIESISGSQITAASLSVGQFNPGDIYQIRSNHGQTTGPNDSSNLIDSDKNFNVMGIQPGDLAVNLTDRSIGRVSAVTNATTLVIEQMYLGMDNDFDMGDYYYFPRYNTDNATRHGLLSFHETGKHFNTGFSVDWDFSAATVTSSPAGLTIEYDTSLKNYAETSGGNSETVTIDRDNGYCIWVVENIADCLGIFSDVHLVKGTVTFGTNTSVLNDSNADFTGDGVKEGDIVENYDDEISIGVSGTATAGTSSLALEDTTKNFNALGIIPYYHLIHNNITSDRGLITGITNANTLSVAGFDNRPPISFASGNTYTIYAPQDVVVTNVPSSIQLNTSRLTAAAPDFDYDAGGTGGYQEFYRIKVASKKLSGTEGGGSSGSTLDGGATDFTSAGVEVGDIVKNIVDSSYGTITSVSGTTLTATLYSGTTNQFNVGDTYEVYYDYVNTRQYEFRVRFSNTPNVYTSGNLRKRDVCPGYNADCSAVTGTVTLPVHTTPAVTIRDYDINNVEVGNASVPIPASTSGSIRIAGLDYYLHETNGELPDWFIKNNWHRFVYVAYSADYAPGGAADCINSVNCLTLVGAGAPNDDKQAIVIIAGDELDTQDRSSATLNSYFEGMNSIVTPPDNDVFEKAKATSIFNDQIKVLATP